MQFVSRRACEFWSTENYLALSSGPSSSFRESFPFLSRVCINDRNYIIYRFNCAWRYLDRHRGNPTVQCTARLAAEFPPFLTPAILTHTYIHFRPYLRTLDTDSLLDIAHGITIARDLRLRRLWRRLPLDIRDYCTTWQDTCYFNVDRNFLTGTKDAAKVFTMICYNNFCQFYAARLATESPIFP